MTKLVIVNRWNGNVICEGEFADIKSLLIAFPDADLSGADLNDANLSGANLRRANLNYANLSGANLSGANLRRANLSAADLNDADLSGADLNDADLSGANLNDANLNYANLSGANLSGANLSGANLRRANLDYSAWPLQCTSTKAIVDDRIKAQLLYHSLCLVGDSFTIPEEIKDFVNKNFHRIGELPKL